MNFSGSCPRRKDDRVQCHSCRISVSGWSPFDNPERVHGALSKDCTFLQNRRAIEVVRLAIGRDNQRVDSEYDREKTICKVYLTNEMNCKYYNCKHVSTCVAFSARCLDVREDQQSVCPLCNTFYVSQTYFCS